MKSQTHAFLIHFIVHKFYRILEHQYILVMATIKRFVVKMSWFVVLLLIILNLISIVEGTHMSKFGPFPNGSGGGEPFGPFGGDGREGVGPFGGGGPFGGRPFGFPINGSFPSFPINGSLPGSPINSVLPGSPFPRFPPWVSLP